MNKPKAIGTKAETWVARHLAANGFPHAERRTLKGRLDEGDITGCLGVVIEVKGGKAANEASDKQVADWMAETETERINARANVGVLVLQRKGVGGPNAGRWWAYMSAKTWVFGAAGHDFPVRMLLTDAVHLLRKAGYGDPLTIEEAAIA
jgi:hypothetical protein